VANSLEQSILKAKAHLTAVQNKNGYWPYSQDKGASLEASSWSLIALKDDSNISSSTRKFLFDSQNADGGWSTRPDAGSSDWGSTLATLAVSLTETENSSAYKKACQFLIEDRTEVYSQMGRILLFLVKGPKSKDYPRGWPWTKGCYHWVEPTTYALLALRADSKAQDMAQIDKQANDFYLEHACKGGGWNHGSNFCLEVFLPPYVVTTAQALVALQNNVQEEKVVQAKTYLEQAISNYDSVMGLSWAIIALDALNTNVEELCQKLIEHQSNDGSFSKYNHLNALSIIALQAGLGHSPLKFPSRVN
jgi:hypothetical protein